ncbi:MAG: hypothetical protein ABIB11_01395 [Candidatus Omnitrophota bacterium]
MKYFERLIFDILRLHRGRENSITIEALSRITLRSRKKIRKAIAKQVNHYHIPIMCDTEFPHGYYIIKETTAFEESVIDYWKRTNQKPQAQCNYEEIT